MKIGDYMYPIYVPFVIPGSATYYAILFYQQLTVYNTAFLHLGIDCFIYSLLASIVYQTEILGYRFSRLGHSEEPEGRTRLNYMKKIVELIKLQFENEKYGPIFNSAYVFKVKIISFGQELEWHCEAL